MHSVSPDLIELKTSAVRLQEAEVKDARLVLAGLNNVTSCSGC
jgi:hypothetical protein